MIHMIQTLALAAIVLTGIATIVGIICYSVLKSDGKLGKSKESASVRAARDNLTVSRLHAERDLIELKRDQVVDARHRGVFELPEGIEEEIKNPKPLKAVVGEILPKRPAGGRGSRD